jgi:hypothetical protein
MKLGRREEKVERRKGKFMSMVISRGQWNTFIFLSSPCSVRAVRSLNIYVYQTSHRLHFITQTLALASGIERISYEARKKVCFHVPLISLVPWQRARGRAREANPNFNSKSKQLLFELLLLLAGSFLWEISAHEDAVYRSRETPAECDMKHKHKHGQQWQ